MTLMLIYIDPDGLTALKTRIVPYDDSMADERSAGRYFSTRLVMTISQPIKKLFAKHPGDIVICRVSKFVFILRNQVAFARLYDKQSFTDFRSFTRQQDTLLLGLLSSGQMDVYNGFLSPVKNIFEYYS